MAREIDPRKDMVRALRYAARRLEAGQIDGVALALQLPCGSVESGYLRSTLELLGAVQHLASQMAWMIHPFDLPLSPEIVRPASAQAKGGVARAAKLSPQRRHEIAVKAAKKRWRK